MNDELGRVHKCAAADFYSCEEALQRLDEYLDHELTTAEREVVVKHLEICKPCFNKFTFEQTLIVSLRTKLSALCIPQPLKDKLRGLLREDREDDASKH